MAKRTEHDLAEVAREAERLREQVSKEQWRVSDIAQALYDMCHENDALAARLAEVERERDDVSAAYLARPNLEAELLQVVIERDDALDRIETLTAALEKVYAVWQNDGRTHESNPGWSLELAHAMRDVRAALDQARGGG